MATAGEGATASTGYEGGGGGVGGKFRKRPFRKAQSTPYDRPATALRNPSWLTKLVVDPATKLISAGAHRFFSSVFRKRLPAPPPPASSSSPPSSPLPLSLPPPAGSNENSAAEMRDGLPNMKNLAATQEEAGYAGGSSHLASDSTGISELEQLLRQKTFTRFEIDRLTELLRSKAVDHPAGYDARRTEVDNPQPLSNAERQQQLLSSPLEENVVERDKSHGVVATPISSSRLVEDDIASPAELAKAYMGSRPSKVSPSMLGLHSQAAREDVINVPFTSKSPVMSLTKKSSGYIGISENGFATPRSRGRSAIYNMARTPYSRANMSASQKGSGFNNYGHNGLLLPPTSQSALELDGYSSKQVVLKRRSSVLDDDIGSGGPMRRIRQKSNLLSHGISRPTHGEGAASGASHPYISSRQKVPMWNEPKPKISRTVGENEGTPSTSFAHVPSKSSEMAAKILEHLEKMTPKEKSTESKLIAAREKSPIKLTPNMLRGQALRSLEDIDTSKVLQNAPDSHKLKGSDSNLLEAVDSTSQNRNRVAENGTIAFISRHDPLSPAVNNNSSATAVNAASGLKSADSTRKELVAQSPLKKRAFKMSAHEDFLELDDDTNYNGPSFNKQMVESRVQSDTTSMSLKLVSPEGTPLDKFQQLPDMKSLPGKETVNSATVKEKNAAADAPSKTFPSIVFPQPATDLKEQSVSPSVSTSSKEGEVIASGAVSSPPSFLGSSGPKPFSWPEPKYENSSSLTDVASTATDTQLKVPQSDKPDDKSILRAGETNGKLDASPSMAPESSSTSSVFSFAGSAKSNNGQLMPVSSSSAPPAPAFTNITNQSSASSSSQFASTSGAGANSNVGSFTASSTSFFVSTTSAPTFSFGSSLKPSSTSAVSTAFGAENKDFNAKMEKGTTFSSISNSSFAGASLAAASTVGSSTFGLNSSTTSSNVTSQSPGSLFTSGSEPLASPKSSAAETGITPVSQSMPVQFGSSASSPIFGTSIFNSNGSGLGSSAPSSKLFGSGSGFNFSQSTSSSETSVVGSTTVGSGIFNFGVNPSASSTEANKVSSNSSAGLGMFQFGVSSSSSSSGTSAVSSNAGAVPAIFSSSVSSSPSILNTSTSNSSSSTASSIFSFGASSSASASGSNASGSNGSSSSIFGSSWQPSKSPVFGSSPFNSTPSSTFSFGASSSSFAAASTAPMVFGSSAAAGSGPVFSFSTASSIASSSPSLSQSQLVFGNTAPTFGAPSANNDQTPMEDSMAEDPVHVSAPAVPVFGQAAASPSAPGFMFGSPVPSSTPSFQFGGQQNQAAPQNPPQFQASGSLEFGGGGSFSLGSGGGDKSNRRIVKVNRNRNRKK